MATPPYGVGDGDLFIAYFASAEFSCHLALGWALPTNVLDLYTEFRCLTNGVTLPCGAGLLGALAFFGISGVDGLEKDEMRALALRGGQYTPAEKVALLNYNREDVIALGRLLPRMLPTINLDQALIRGRYMKAVARVEAAGVPIDVDALHRLDQGWPSIKSHLIQRIDRGYGVFEGGTFRTNRWDAWTVANGIVWPRLDSGRLALDDDTFRQMARSHPRVAPMRELRDALSKMRLHELAVGDDARNRTLLSPFRSRTGRNQPSNSRFIFGPAVWLRSLIRSAPGWGVAYVDWSQQEFGIAAALSGDPAMKQAYVSGDPYLAFAKQAGMVPADATKKSHSAERELCKQAVLAVQYGMGPASLASRLDKSPIDAKYLLDLHRRTYPTYWRWSDAVLDDAQLRTFIETRLGWRLRVGTGVNPRSLRNFPMQANGAEMLRLACIFATERGIRVCAPVHDALLIEAPLDGLDTAVIATQQAMCEASAVVLDGFALRSDAKLYRYPERYTDPRGEEMWSTVWDIIDQESCCDHAERPVAG